MLDQIYMTISWCAFVDCWTFATWIFRFLGFSGSLFNLFEPTDNWQLPPKQHWQTFGLVLHVVQFNKRQPSTKYINVSFDKNKELEYDEQPSHPFFKGAPTRKPQLRSPWHTYINLHYVTTGQTFQSLTCYHVRYLSYISFILDWLRHWRTLRDWASLGHIALTFCI